MTINSRGVRKATTKTEVVEWAAEDDAAAGRNAISAKDQLAHIAECDANGDIGGAFFEWYGRAGHAWAKAAKEAGVDVDDLQMKRLYFDRLIGECRKQVDESDERLATPPAPRKKIGGPWRRGVGMNPL